jgi:hypothetical protein
MEAKSHSHEFRQTVGESFNIYQATVAMIAIFIGFVFSGLLLILTSPDKIDISKYVVIWSLIVAMVSLLTALFSFHATAHRVISYWGIFYPVSIFSIIGGIAMNVGILAMFSTVAVLLMSRGIFRGAIFVATYGILLIMYTAFFRPRNGGRASHFTPVDNCRGCIQTVTPTTTNSHLPVPPNEEGGF